MLLFDGPTMCQKVRKMTLKLKLSKPYFVIIR